MKKLSRIAALLAAGALLFGAVGCSDSDDDGGKTGGGVEVTASVAPAIALEEGEDDTYVVTCTVTGDTFSADAKSLGKGDEIPAGYLELTANDSKVTISEVKVSEKFTDTVGKVSIKVTAAAGAKSGTITAKLLKGALTDTTDTVTATSISYTIKVDEGKGPSELTFPLSIKPTTEGSSPAYPTDADLEEYAELVFTSPIAYTVRTKKKFDTGKINTGSGTETVSRWNLGGAFKTSSGGYNCYMKFDSAPSAKMTVKFFNTNADRTLTVVSGTTETAGKVKTTVITDSSGTKIGDLMSETFTVTKGSEVYLGATTNGIWVTEIVWEE